MADRLPSSADNRALAWSYDRLWDDSRLEVASGQTAFDPPPHPGSSRWGISAILRPDGEAAARLVAEAAVLMAFTGPQLAYTRSLLHTTLRSLEGYRVGVTADDEAARWYATRLAEAASGFGVLAIEYRGLTASNLGVMAQGWPLGNDLARLRGRLHQLLGHHNRLLGPEASHPRSLAHASLIVFTGPLSQPSRLADYIEQHRSTAFGIAVFDTIDLVAYQRASAHLELIHLASVRL